MFRQIKKLKFCNWKKTSFFVLAILVLLLLSSWLGLKIFTKQYAEAIEKANNNQAFEYAYESEFAQIGFGKKKDENISITFSAISDINKSSPDADVASEKLNNKLSWFDKFKNWLKKITKRQDKKKIEFVLKQAKIQDNKNIAKDLLTKDINQNFEKKKLEKVIKEIFAKQDTIAGEIELIEQDGKQYILHPDVADRTDVRYQVLGNKGLKEEIVIKSSEGMKANCLNDNKDKSVQEITSNCTLPKNQYVFDLNLEQGVKIKKQVTGIKDFTKQDMPGKSTYYFVDKDDKYIAHLKSFFAIDGADQKTNAIDIQINDNQLILSLDLEWMLNPARVYPIIIDPSIVHDTQAEFQTGTENRVETTSDPQVQLNYNELPADEHTVGLWHMNNDWTDSSGNGNNGTATGATFSTSTNLGSHAGSFDGVDDYISVSADSLINLNNKTKYSIEAWVKPDSDGEGDQGRILEKGDTYLRVDSESDNKVEVTCNIDLATTDANANTSTTMSISEWHHVVCGWEAESNEIKIYIDGQEAQLNSPTIGSGLPTDDSSSILYIGGDNGANTFDGLIDEVRISNIARTPEEIKASAQHRPYGVYSSEVIDLTSDVQSIDDIQWTETLGSYGDVEFMTRTGTDDSPWGDTVNWEEWKPMSGVETQMLSMDSDSSNWNWDQYWNGSAWAESSDYSKWPVNKANNTQVLAEGSGSLKVDTGQSTTANDTIAYWQMEETNGDLAGKDVFDSSINNYDAEMENLSPVKGLTGMAKDFNGSNSSFQADWLHTTGLIPSKELQMYGFSYPSDIAIDSDGNVFVADSSNHRIQKFNSAGTFISRWGTNGSGDGQFSYPSGVAIDSDGNVFVADLSNHRIQKFNSAGTFISRWGTNGSGDGQFSSPTGVAIDSDGNVFVADAYNHRIQKFNSTGTFISKWGTNGSGDGQFDSPYGVAIDSDDNVFVADRNNHRIQKFNSSGTFITKWGTSGSGDGQFNNPWGVAIDSDDNVFVADTYNHRIQKFNGTGIFITKWGTSGSGDGQFYKPYGVAIDSDGNVFVADSWNCRIQKFNSTGTFISKWDTKGSGDGQFKNPYGVAIDSDGNIFVADSSNHRIQKFNSTGTFISKWGINGSGDGQFSYPYDIAIDSDGNVFVADRNNHRIQKFNSTGTFITKWGTNGTGNGQFSYPYGVAIDSDGNVFVADSSNHRIQKFNSTGTFITKWGTNGTGNGQFNNPYGVAIDSDGNVFVADSSNHRIQKFNSTGTFITKWGTNGSGDGQFKNPYGVAIDSDGNVFVADRNNHRIQKFNSTGTFITKWGTNGTGDGQFSYPSDIAIDSDGNVFVADRNNHRIQKTSLAVSGRFYLDSVFSSASSSNMMLADKGAYRLYLDATDGKLTFDINTARYKTDIASWQADQWYYFTAQDSFLNGQGGIYINGQKDSGSPTTITTTTMADHLVIGKKQDNTQYFDGRLDELKLDQKLLTPEEIAESYRMGRDHYLSRTLTTSQNLSTNTKMPFWIAGDRPGSYLDMTIGESAFANGQPDANTVGLWRLEEENNVTDTNWVKDSSGNGNHGTLGGGTTSAVPSSVQGKVGKARSFDDSDDFVEIADDNTLDLSSNGTISAWIKTNNNENDNWFLCKNGNYCLGVNSTGALLFTGNSAQNDGGTNIQSGEWHHVAVTNNNTTATYYIDGVQTATDSVGWGTTLTNNLRLGRDGGTNYFDGIVDEIRIDNILRTATEVRQAYEIGRRTHSITIDFGASLDSANLITDSSDTSFTIDATTQGFSNKGDNLYSEDKIIIKENYNGTEYIAQGDVTSVNQSTGAITIDAWDTGSSFPLSGFTTNATVFKWQREYFDIRGSQSTDRDATTRIDLRVTDGNEGRTVWLDDINSAGAYLTDGTGTDNVQSTLNRYIQYRGIFSTWDQDYTPYVTDVTLNYSSGPSLEQLMRHGKWFNNGEKQSFWWVAN